ncbi:MAG: phage holin family protein [Bacteroidetes bacterium]|nr:phage holin family protein [Bacteroidota bacterium]
MITEEKEKIEHLIEHAEEYINTRQELLKLIVAEKTSTVLSSVMSNLIISFIFFFVFVFASFGLAYFIAEYIGKTYLGFIATAGIYFVIGLLLHWNREKLLRTPFMNSIIKNYFKDEQN